MLKKATVAAVLSAGTNNLKTCFVLAFKFVSSPDVSVPSLDCILTPEERIEKPGRY